MRVTASARVMISAWGRYLHRVGGGASTLFPTLPLTRHPEPTPTPNANANANPNTNTNTTPNPNPNPNLHGVGSEAAHATAAEAPG